MPRLLAVLFALALFSGAPSAQAQSICWDTVCAAGTPAADCWRAWCADGWSYPAYPYRAPGWYRADLPSPYTYGGARYWGVEPTIRTPLVPLTRAAGCSTGDPRDWAIWGC